LAIEARGPPGPKAASISWYAVYLSLALLDGTSADSQKTPGAGRREDGEERGDDEAAGCLRRWDADREGLGAVAGESAGYERGDAMELMFVIVTGGFAGLNTMAGMAFGAFFALGGGGGGMLVRCSRITG
jgi:hypothetical protein